MKSWCCGISCRTSPDSRADIVEIVIDLFRIQSIRHRVIAAWHNVLTDKDVREKCPSIPDSEPGYGSGTTVPSSETNRRSDGWMLVRTLAYARTGRSAGKVMVANRSLGNPTGRDDTGGLRNRLCYGSRTEAPREIEGIAIGPYRARAPQFYPNNLRLLRPNVGVRRSKAPTNADLVISGSLLNCLLRSLTIK
jgi:hypothetical protein